MNNTGFSERIEITPILGWVLSGCVVSFDGRFVTILSMWRLRRDTLPSRDRSTRPPTVTQLSKSFAS
jgi:hypothetical protein